MAKKSKAKKKTAKKKKAAPARKKKKTVKAAPKKAAKKVGQEGGSEAQGAGEEAGPDAGRRNLRPLRPGPRRSVPAWAAVTASVPVRAGDGRAPRRQRRGAVAVAGVPRRRRRLFARGRVDRRIASRLGRAS